MRVITQSDLRLGMSFTELHWISFRMCSDWSIAFSISSCSRGVVFLCRNQILLNKWAETIPSNNVAVLQTLWSLAIFTAICLNICKIIRSRWKYLTEWQKYFRGKTIDTNPSKHSGVKPVDTKPEGGKAASLQVTNLGQRWHWESKIFVLKPTTLSLLTVQRNTLHLQLYL